jgi:hypothetical protein
VLAFELGGEVRELDALTLLGVLPGFDDPTDQSCVHAALRGNRLRSGFDFPDRKASISAKQKNTETRGHSGVLAMSEIVCLCGNQA